MLALWKDISLAAGCRLRSLQLKVHSVRCIASVAGCMPHAICIVRCTVAPTSSCTALHCTALRCAALLSSARYLQLMRVQSIYQDRYIADSLQVRAKPYPCAHFPAAAVHLLPAYPAGPTPILDRYPLSCPCVL